MLAATLAWLWGWVWHLVVVACAIYVGARIHRWYWQFVRYRRGSNAPELGFFHPYCDGGGGGERVLWQMLTSVQQPVIIYTVSKKSGAEILDGVWRKFGIRVPESRIEWVRANHEWLINAASYPRLTLVGQCLGSMLFAFLALWRSKSSPRVFIDTTGFHFTFPVARWLFDCRIATYVHYPTISADMIGRAGTAAYNNSGRIARSKVLSALKAGYLRALAWLYGAVGRLSEVTMVNSTWTQNHIRELWRTEPHRVFPPCDVEAMVDLRRETPPACRPLLLEGANGCVRHETEMKESVESGHVSLWFPEPTRFDRSRVPAVCPYADAQALNRVLFGRPILGGESKKGDDSTSGGVCRVSRSSAGASLGRCFTFLSIGQFRPEKDHALQLRAFAGFVQRLQDACSQSLDESKQTDNAAEQYLPVRLLLLGGVRNAGDQKLLCDLEDLAMDLGIQKYVVFVPNAPYSLLKHALSVSDVGTHSMWNEHFGICVVEYMAAGLVPIAHDSGGPKFDILAVRRKSCGEMSVAGYLAGTQEQFEAAFWDVYAGDGTGGTPDDVPETGKLCCCQCREDHLDTLREKAMLKSGSYSGEMFDLRWREQLQRLGVRSEQTSGNKS